jgi:LPS-assembly protein
MHKILLLIICLSIFSFAKNSIKDENLQILAKNLQIKDDIINASGEVVVYSPNYYITANKLIYDKINSKLELFGEVNVIKNNEVMSYSQYMFLDIKNDKNILKPMFMLDNTSKLWFNAENSTKNKDLIDLKKSTLSSCDCLNPAWSISFSSGDMNTTDKWVNTYNTTLYIKDVPVFYTPYFGFPTDTTRRSGLLKPTVGYSETEGFVYAQPIYYAPKLNYDIQYTPQIRTNRGKGNTLKYRYVDSLYSNLEIEAGIFKENDTYFKKMSLSNQKHYGWDLAYNRSKLISDDDTSDGLLIKYTDMNDVDYLDTQKNSSSSLTTSNVVESEAKYYYNTNNYYSDVAVNLYNELDTEDNDAVLQTIPKVNFHKYSKGYLNNNITSSLNISSSKKTRKTGVGATTTDMYIPIGYHQYLIDEFLNFSFTEQISYTNIAYSNTNNYEDANYGENNHVFSLYSDLIKPYDRFIHSVSLSATYTDSNIFKKSGDIYDTSDSSTSDLSPFPITQTSKNISFAFNQSFYNKENLKEIVNHKINQSYVYSKETNSYEKNTLENDLTFNFDYGSISNRLIYNYSIKDFTTSSTSLTLKKDSYFANIYYTELKNEDTLIEDKNFNYDLGFSFAKYYKLSFKESYDLVDHVRDSREYMFNIDKKCWAMNFKVIDSLVASDTTTSTDSYRQKILYIEINLKQLFLIDQEYALNERD